MRSGAKSGKLLVSAIAIKKPQRHWQVALELLPTQPPPRFALEMHCLISLHLSAHCGDDSRVVSGVNAHNASGLC